MNLAVLEADLARHGLMPRGGFNFGDDALVPAGALARRARAVVLVGQAGAALWPHFREWRARQQSSLENPLDSWCREIIGDVAQRHGARAVSPSDRPYLPFQQWAMRAEKLRASPLGILMHPQFGLWHAYRGALLFDVELKFGKSADPIHLCDGCETKPCLRACPVQAHSEAGFDHVACLAHVRSPKGRCMEGGCFDRNACPFGVAYRYPAEVQEFHMSAFARG
jgi:ferredoxin